MGNPIDSLNMAQTIDRIEQFISERKPRQHVVVNVAKIVEMQNDPDLREIIASCDLINADGMPIVWASRLLGSPLPSRVAGVELFQNLVKLCAEKKYRPFFFGARDWVVKKMIEEFKKRYPKLNIAGYRNGYYSEDEEEKIAEMVRESKSDILFVGFSSPMKEKFLNRWMSIMQVPFCMGVGGSFDIIAGKTKRAPLWMQKAGLEWVYRIYQEPRRMWKRYAKTNPIFMWMVVKEWIRQKR
jgi:N-acetylglucosaminyldiphosphoundecaprenol N-acetyl-beta-D-mannosaminyltransferase